MVTYNNEYGYIWVVKKQTTYYYDKKNVETLRPDTNETLDTQTLDYFYTEYIIKHGIKKKWTAKASLYLSV